MEPFGNSHAEDGVVLDGHVDGKEVVVQEEYVVGKLAKDVQAVRDDLYIIHLYFITIRVFLELLLEEMR
jgi:hypothetical protein